MVSLTDAASRPALQVFFDSGASEVPGDLAPRAADLLAYLKANDTVKAVISGFNDPPGDAAANDDHVMSRHTRPFSTQWRRRVMRSAVSGVSVDEESINLLSFQRQYQASARFISAVGEITQTPLSLV